MARNIVKKITRSSGRKEIHTSHPGLLFFLCSFMQRGNWNNHRLWMNTSYQILFQKNIDRKLRLSREKDITFIDAYGKCQSPTCVSNPAYVWYLLDNFPLHSNLLHPKAEAKFIRIIPTLTITTKQMFQHMLTRTLLSPVERRSINEKGRAYLSPPRKQLFGCCEALALLKKQMGAESN